MLISEDKAEKSSSATVSFQKYTHHEALRALFVCQMVFITIWRFLFLYKPPPYTEVLRIICTHWRSPAIRPLVFSIISNGSKKEYPFLGECLSYRLGWRAGIFLSKILQNPPRMDFLQHQMLVAECGRCSSSCGQLRA